MNNTIKRLDNGDFEVIYSEKELKERKEAEMFYIEQSKIRESLNRILAHSDNKDEKQCYVEV